MNVFSVEVY